ncbi:hypothetical protein EDD16DRAFT_1115776 [Pisolithus croceorrhizus]|nr:hypothetical protein EDD16DRAFT_1115776 [Pisolithus croceorrhizus]
MVTIIDAVLGGDTSKAEGYVRVASMAFAFYDYIITLPIEYRVYRSQRGFFHMSLACILFILIRYSSILVMVTSNYGFFATTFTDESCRRYYYVAPIFKDIQATVSQAILGVRTFNIAGRNKHLGLFLLVYFCITVTLEWFFDLYRRTSQVVDGNCVSGIPDSHPTTWLFYLIAMIYDIMALVVSTIHLIRYKTYSGKFSFLIRVMIYDGLIFFVVLTAVNIFNLILYQQPDVVAQVSFSPNFFFSAEFTTPVDLAVHRSFARICCRLDNESTNSHPPPGTCRGSLDIRRLTDIQHRRTPRPQFRDR